MEHSKLLLLRKRILKLDMDSLNDELIKKQYDIAQIMDDYPDDMICELMDGLIDTTLSMTKSMDLLSLQHIEELDVKIRISTKKNIDFDNIYWEKHNVKFKTADYIREYQQLKISDASLKLIRARIGLYTDSRYPGLEIGPGDGEWTGSLVACDPLYLVDYNDEFLTATKNTFSKKYQARLRCYTNKGTGLHMLPQGQFGFVFSWNMFNYLSFNQIAAYLDNIHNVLRPGGVCMFSYNNAELPINARRGEEHLMSFIPKSVLHGMIDDYRFTDIKMEDADENISWVEFRRHGKLTTKRTAQTLGKIIPASSVKT